jgi:N-acetylglucosaminyldiphosphoundecaprenol N-acetyl-beta-D-mannosaminyltransferase
MTRAADTISFLGISVQPKTLPELMALLDAAINENQQCVIANHNLHSLYLFHREPELRSFYRGADWTHIDGMPIVALARLYGYDVRSDQRVTYVDWTGPIMEAAAKNQWRIFYLGSPPGVAGKGAAVLAETYPGLQIRTMHGYFDLRLNGTENENVIQAITAYEPNILMVGMGMPRQEYWIHQNRSRLRANVILPSGAAMDYFAGAVPTPPRWAGRLGLEWAFRLFAEPQRLWRRYLLEPWSLLGRVARDFPWRLSRSRALPASEE